MEWQRDGDFFELYEFLIKKASMYKRLERLKTKIRPITKRFVHVGRLVFLATTRLLRYRGYGKKTSNIAKVFTKIIFIDVNSSL